MANLNIHYPRIDCESMLSTHLEGKAVPVFIDGDFLDLGMVLISTEVQKLQQCKGMTPSVPAKMVCYISCTMVWS